MLLVQNFVDHKDIVRNFVGYFGRNFVGDFERNFEENFVEIG